MAESDAVVETLGHWPKQILSALDQHDGSASSSEITEFLGAENTTRINYHVTEHLESSGLVETHQPQSGPGPNAPKKYTLTDAGKDALDHLAEEQELHRDIAERIERLEAQVDALRDENQDLREQLETGNSQSPSTRDSSQMEELQEQVGRIAMELEELKDDPLFDEGFRSDLDDFRVGTLALTDYMLNELDAEDEIAELSAEYEDQIDLLSQ